MCNCAAKCFAFVQPWWPINFRLPGPWNCEWKTVAVLWSWIWSDKIGNREGSGWWKFSQYHHKKKWKCTWFPYTVIFSVLVINQTIFVKDFWDILQVYMFLCLSDCLSRNRQLLSPWTSRLLLVAKFCLWNPKVVFSLTSPFCYRFNILVNIITNCYYLFM